MSRHIRRSPRRRALPNRSTKHRHAECTTGLCKACNWNAGSVPTAWLTEHAGTPYPCKSKVIGRKVRLRGDPRESTVVGCATPLGETIFQHGKRGKAYKCQGAFIVRSDFGRGVIETPVPKSVVRARIRHAKDKLCPDAAAFKGSEMRGYTRSMELEAKKSRRHPFDLVGDLPFPHRDKSSPCCGNSPISPDRLDALLSAWMDSGEEADYFALANAVRRALPKHLRAITELESRAQIERGITAVRDHCWSLWLDKEARSTDSRKAFQRRVKADRKAMAQAGLPLTRGQRKRSASKDSADFDYFMRSAELVSENQFLKRTPAEQRLLVKRAFRRARKKMSSDFVLSLYEGRDLLGRAVVELARGESIRR